MRRESQGEGEYKRYFEILRYAQNDREVGRRETGDGGRE